MAKLPYFPCYARDVISSNKIAIMSGDAFKAYWILLCTSWLEDERATLPKEQANRVANGIANGQSNLQALARVTPEVWLKIKHEVLACFEETKSGRLYNERLKEISDLLYKRSKAGSKGGTKTQAKRQAKRVANTQQVSESESKADSKAESNREKKEEVATIVPTAYINFSRSFLEKQKEQFPNESSLNSSFEDCVIDGAKKLWLFHIKEKWGDIEIKALLIWILEDGFWSRQIRTLGGIRNRKQGKGTPMKLENAKASMEMPPAHETALEKYERLHTQPSE